MGGVDYSLVFQLLLLVKNVFILSSPQHVGIWYCNLFELVCMCVCHVCPVKFMFKLVSSKTL